MMNRLCSNLLRIRALGLLCVLVVCCAPVLRADSVPDWFRELAKAPLPAYPPEADAVIVLNESTVTVKDANDITLTHRWVAKILRPSGRELRRYEVPFSNDTRITYLKGWSIAANGQEYTVKEKDAAETSAFASFEFFSDDRKKMIQLPAAEPGAYIAVEYVQKKRPYVLEEDWFMQDDNNPVRTSRLTVTLPAGWEYSYHFANATETKPQNTGPNQWTWEITDVSGYEVEPDMPNALAVNGRIVIHFHPPGPSNLRASSWGEIGAWDNRMNSSRRTSTTAIHDRVAQLTSGKSDPVERIRALAAYVQSEIRYVAVEVGIGGRQAHMAGDIFANRYGDCKDKATLLATMLKEDGVDSYLVSVDTHPGVVKPEIPSIVSDHMILAIKLPDGANTDTLFAVVDDKKAGKLLIFDPTEEKTPLGWLPPYLQGSYGLVSLPDGGELVRLPLLAPSLNRLLRIGELELLPDGTLKGDIQELRTGHFATSEREMLLSQTGQDRDKVFEHFLAGSLSRYEITRVTFKDLESTDKPLTVSYSFESPGYARTIGGLVLVRPRVIGEKASAIAEGKPRRFPVEFHEGPASESDIFDIKLPPGTALDELPAATDVVYDFAEYHSRISVKDGALHYERTYTVKDVTVPLEKMDQFKSLMRQIGGDERNTAVLKRVAAQ